MKSLIIALLCTPMFVLGQAQPNDLFSLKFGYNTTLISIKEAVRTKSNLFGLSFDHGNTYSGDGIHFGLAKNISDHLFVDLSAVFFSGEEQIVHAANYLSVLERSYTLKGFRIPASINYLFRSSSKRLRPNIGAGLQYLNFAFHQFEMQQSNGLTTNKEIAYVNTNEIQLLLSPGIQYRIIDELYVSFIVNVGIGKRYIDAPTISLKYAFKNKKLANPL